MKLGLLAIATFLTLGGGLSPARAEIRPVVVELFTSQGCSSCPPADALLGELAMREGVIALGYHISYWDRLGWKDPLSSEAATKRQIRYARQLNGGQVYTPELVVDGVSDVVGSDRDAVLKAVSTAHPDTVAPVTIATDRRSIAIGSGHGGGEVLLVRFTKHRTTQVGAGENSGRTADDFNGVQSIVSLGAWSGAPATFPLEPPGPEDGLAVLVQAPENRILGAAIAFGGG